MKLQPYQESVLSKGDRPFALHGTGTGKTLTSLKFIEKAQAEYPNKPVVLVTSSALRDNLAKEKSKHDVNVDLDNVITVTHEGMSRPTTSKVITDVLKDGGTLVLDEIHKLRNPTSKGYLNTMHASRKANKVLGLTGTGIVNEVEDLAHLYNLVQGNTKASINDYVGERITKPTLMDKIRGNRTPKVTFEVTNPAGLKKSFTSLDIYYPPKDHPDMPLVTSRIKEVDMSKEQTKAYMMAEEQSIKGRKDYKELARKVRAGIELTKSERAKSNAFASQTSQAAISSARHLGGDIVYSNKIDETMKDLKEYMSNNPEHRGVIYTNKITAGVNPLVNRLNSDRLGHLVQVVQGATDKRDVQDIVQNYNSGRKPILVISDSGAEGLDLKGTRSIQVLQPHFNDGKIKQAVGRGARFKSHSHLPEDQRNIEVTHYHSTFKGKGLSNKKDKTIDQAMHLMTTDKANRRDTVISVLSS